VKTYTEFVNEAMSRKDALKMAAAKASFFRKGGKVENQPPSVAMGYTKKRGMKLGKTSHASGTLDLYRGADDQDAAKKLKKSLKTRVPISYLMKCIKTSFMSVRTISSKALM